MQALEKAVDSRPDHRLHAFIIAVAPTGEPLKQLAAQAGVHDIGVAFVTGQDPLDEYQINKSAHNTVLLYDHHKVVSRLVNLQANPASLAQLQQSLMQLP
ncbi:MAG: hypothetical protein ACYCW6_03870 [Candidatus Xenobia bacterium]